MKSLLKKILFGIDHPQEYICARAGDIENVVNCFILSGGKKIKVGNDLLFLGYSPLLFGWITESFSGNEIEIMLEHNSKPLAKIKLVLLSELVLENKKLLAFKGVSSEQNFETAFHQFMFRVYDRLRPKHSFNIDLSPQLYNQVKVAYSIPREIKLITLGDGKAWNVFPTDLHGFAGDSHYIISLRHDKKACKQVEEIRKLALWTVIAESAKETYALGKNHSKDLSASPGLFTENTSSVLHFPEPAGSISGIELELEKVIGDYGIHRLLLFKIISGQKDETSGRLMHLHRSYVQWHIKNGFKFTEAKR